MAYKLKLHNKNPILIAPIVKYQWRRHYVSGYNSLTHNPTHTYMCIFGAFHVAYMSSDDIGILSQIIDVISREYGYTNK